MNLKVKKGGLVYAVMRNAGLHNIYAELHDAQVACNEMNRLFPRGKRAVVVTLTVK